MLNRRDLLKYTGLACIAPIRTLLTTTFIDKATATRCINVVNFIRGVEPRFETDLLLPVQKQMEIILQDNLPATWLLQFDALVDPKFTDYLKAHMPVAGAARPRSANSTHEVGFWFEMNQKLCNAANVEWRGRPGYEWDHLPPVAFTIGYTPGERIKLADTAIREFKKVWGHTPKSVASWNLDSITMAHLTDHYGIDAFAVCRDQIATDGFTIWGAPIAGYYPSKTNCWSPALDRHNQIDTPVFRMLGQDPVRYYTRSYRLPDGRVISEPDTMEPVWTSGRSPSFIKAFLKMIADDPTLRFAYAQLGQENSFPWRDQADAYPIQMKALAELRDTGKVHVETMGQSGRRFKKAFTTTPAQAQVMLDDPVVGLFRDDVAGAARSTSPNKPTTADPASSINVADLERAAPATVSHIETLVPDQETTIWYQSRYYRANLHFKDDLPFFRDITVYSDHFPQPFLNQATRQNDVEQRMPAVLDCYHWGDAGGYLVVDGVRITLIGKPQITEDDNILIAVLPFKNGRLLAIKFEEKGISMNLVNEKTNALSLSFEWDPSKSALKEVQPIEANYHWQGYDYAVRVIKGTAAKTQHGWMVSQVGNEISLHLAQPR